MVTIGDKPILMHIMQHYATHGITDFVVCLGYKGDFAFDYFDRNFAKNSVVINVTGRSESYAVPVLEQTWSVTLVDTGLATMTGGRLKRVAELLTDETFCLTYGDGLSDIDIRSEIAFHKSHSKLATVAAVRPPGRFAVLELDENANVSSFKEKPQNEVGWVNGGFFVLEPSVIGYLDTDETIWEQSPLELLAADGQLAAFRHEGFWQPMDTLRDRRILEDLWNKGLAPWG
jgi:glucose-1-phosphate cytidylyltransferase